MSGLDANQRRPQSLAVGSLEWTQNELGVARGFVYDSVEDFAYAARRDLEWLNEHMTGIVNWQQGYVKKSRELCCGTKDPNCSDFAKLMQTPGRLRSNDSPRKLRLQALEGSDTHAVCFNVEFLFLSVCIV